MKKIIVILGAVVIVITAGIVAYNSSSTLSTNSEGITELPQQRTKDSTTNRSDHAFTPMQSMK